MEGIPYLPYLDLAIIFHVLVELDEQGERMATMLIRNEHLKWWKVSADDMYEEALKNTERLLPSELSSMFMIIEEILPEWERP